MQHREATLKSCLQKAWYMLKGLVKGTHPDVQQYCDIMIDQYKHQPIVPTDWPPPVGQDFFGKLALLQTQDRHSTSQTILQKQWCMLRGQVDKIPQVTQDKQIDIQDVLKPCDSGQSLRVIVDGPPGIGKTTLCHKLLNMWTKGELTHGKYNLVLYCPLRNHEVAQANEIKQLLKYTYDCNEVTTVTEWLQKIHGQGLLIIFDGWDELSTDLRQSSLATRIIRREILAKCSVIVTSRSYASYSLLKISSVNRHVEVLGFSEEEMKAVIKGTLEKEPHLAEKLIQDLKVRGDVQSLCYVPLVCSIVILVYRQSDGQLPTTLTELYENFILQTIRRHVDKRVDNIKPVQVYSLHHLPSVLDTTFKEICQFAYLSLKENNPKMTFSSFQLCQSLGQSEKEGYLGLMTTFIVGIEERYQFLHLSIQEFLAAWWIAKYEKTEEVFSEHFDNDHFRMCLMFVAGLTHLEDESYQQYFNKELDLQCKRRPLFGFEKCYYSHFNQNSTTVRPHISSLLSDKWDDIVFQLLFESQNTKLCQILSQSIKNHSLCLHRRRSSLFDMLCIGFFFNNSNITWNYLDLGTLYGQEVQLLTNTLMDNIKCKRLEIEVWFKVKDQKAIKLFVKLFQSSFSHNLQECYIKLDSYRPQDISDVTLVLLHLIKLQHLKILHFETTYSGELEPGEDYIQIDKRILSELEESLYINSTLQELVLDIRSLVRGIPNLSSDIDNTVYSVIKGVTRNKSIQTFSLECYYLKWTEDILSKEIYDKLVRDNHTIQSLKLNIPNVLSPDIVNTSLTALESKSQMWYHEQTSLFPQHIKGLHCLILDHRQYSVPLPLLFQCYPNLQQLQLTLNTAESVIELFTILQSNTTVKALKVVIWDNTIYDSMGPSLQDMLIVNKTIEFFEIDHDDFTNTIPNTYLSFLTSGLSHNTSLQELSVSIPLSYTNYEQITTLFNVISHKNKLTELKVRFKLDQTYESNYCSYEERKQIMIPLFYEQGLPLITNMLKSHTTMRLLYIQCDYFDNQLSQPNWIEVSQHFCQTTFLHPTIQYIGIKPAIGLLVLRDTLKSQEKTLIDTHIQQQPLKPLPIIDMCLL